MTTPRPGDAFHLDLDGTVITGHYVEVDSPNRILIEWDRRATDTATPTPSLIEITFTPTGDGTAMTVQFEGLTAEDAAFHRQLWRRYIDRIAAAFGGAAPDAAPGN